MSSRDFEKSMTVLFKTESGKIIATLVRLLGDLDQAEEALQEAFSLAWETWKKTGIPNNPKAWLISTARFKTIDRIRREQRGRELIKASWSSSCRKSLIVIARIV